MGGIGLQDIVSLRGFEYPTTVTFKEYFFPLLHVFIAEQCESPGGVAINIPFITLQGLSEGLL